MIREGFPGRALWLAPMLKVVEGETLGDKAPAGTKADVSLPLWGTGVGVLVGPFLSCWCELPRSRHKVLIAGPSELRRPWASPLYGV